MTTFAEVMIDELNDRKISIVQQHVALDIERKCVEILDAGAVEILRVDEATDIDAWVRMQDAKGRAIAATYELVPARMTPLGQKLIDGIRGFKTYGR
jgi:hypothetical protein